MEQYVIKGGNPLVGEVEIGGAKNAALAIISAAVMTDETVTIENLPNVRDINVLLNAISDIGAKVDRLDAHTVKMNGSFIHNLVVDNEYIRKIRASYYLLGALLGKYKHAEVALPGGCDIGSRPFDLHLKGFRALGATVDIRHGLVVADAKQLKGTHIYLDKVSVGATINIMMAAAMAEGKTTLENAAKEPHVVDAANFLNSMGANIRGAGTDVIRIVGVEKLHKTEYSIIPDQIEAGTFMLAAAATKGDVTVKNVIPKHLEAISAKLLEIGCEVEEFDDAVRVVSSKPLHHTQVTTLPYPGFPTDMQPQIAVVEGIVDSTNIGAIFRGAAALGMDAVLLSPSCCDPLCRRAVRVSMGTVFQVPWATLGDTPADWPEKGMDRLHAMGFKTAAMALDDRAVSIDDPALQAEEKLAIVLGTEGDGLAHSTIARCDYTVMIPMQHGVDSLNVAAAGAVAFWELRKR